MATDVERLGDSSATSLTDAFAELERAAARWCDRDFLVIDHRAQTISFNGLRDGAARFGRLLRKRGVSPGDRVCLAMSNSVEWVVAAFAVLSVGGVIVPLSTRLVDREVRHCLELARPRTVILHGHVRRRNLVAEWPCLREVSTDDGRAIDVLVHQGGDDMWSPPTAAWDTGQPSSPPFTAAPSPGPEGAAAILFTSGTTSAPKGVVLTHRGLLRDAYEVGLRQEVRPDDRFFSVAPFFHCSGLMHALFTTLLAGATLFTASRYMPDDSLRLIEQEAITVAHGPLPPAAPAAHRSRRASPFPAFTRAWTGGTCQQLEATERALGVKTCSLWGMTETGGCFALTSADDDADVRHRSAGRPMPGLEFRIVDGDKNEVVQDGMPGELYVRGWNVTPGYFRDPVATAAAISEDGWLCTGDLAERMPGGRFRFVGRLKDIIRVGGENLAPGEVETVISEVDGIVDAAVISRPDERLGEVPIAAIVTAPEAVVSARQLHAHCSALLANFKVPRDFYRVDSIPRTHATNRIQRTRLQSEISAGRATHVT